MPRKKQREPDIPHDSPEPLQAFEQRHSTATCCLCGARVLKSGWCDSCQHWPINIRPGRWCESGHRVDPDGWCPGCQDYVLSQLLGEAGAWRDTGITPARLTPERHRALLQACARIAEEKQLAGRHRKPRALQQAELAAWEQERQAGPQETVADVPGWD